MTWMLALGVAAIVSAGVYLALSRDLLRCVVGVSLIAAAANLVVFASGRPGDPSPPVIPPGGDVLAAGAAPLPQALVLTAIVIGFSLTCFSLVVVLAIKQRTGVNDSHALRAAEPHALSDGAPPLEEEDDA
ncbi:MAG: NADH-quinone oxidoreductase subunit K [Myxococcales bacterium]|nr:NADH-quinone oxidoreductase subunit K [Myxococcales bacterium]